MYAALSCLFDGQIALCYLVTFFFFVFWRSIKTDCTTISNRSKEMKNHKICCGTYRNGTMFNTRNIKSFFRAAERTKKFAKNKNNNKNELRASLDCLSHTIRFQTFESFVAAHIRISLAYLLSQQTLCTVNW